MVGVTTNVPSEVAFVGNFSFNTRGYDVLWEQPILVDGMSGVEYAAEHKKISGAVIAELYNPEKEIFIDVGVVLFDPFGFQVDNSADTAKESYEYLFHLVESIKILQ